MSRARAQLQLALDTTSLAGSEELAGMLGRSLTRIEVGTPLLVAAGLRAVGRVRRAAGGAVTVVADTKICDAGERIAAASYEAGADVVTVVAAAIDDQTWQGVVRAARESSSAARTCGILIDAIGWRPDRSTLARWCDSARDDGLRVEVCVHRPKSDPPAFPALIEEVRVSGDTRAGSPSAAVEYAVAGRMTALDVAPALAAGFSTLIVGGAILDSPAPADAWHDFVAGMEQFEDEGDYGSGRDGEDGTGHDGRR